MSAEANHIAIITLPQRVYGLDLSLTATGVAGATLDEHGASWGVDTVASRKRGVERLVELRNSILDAVALADLVVIEGFAYGAARGASSLVSLGELGGVVRVALHEAGIPFVDVPPATVKKFATGKGNAPKDQVLVAAVKRTGGFEFASNDQADAFWLMAMGCEALGAPVVDMPKQNVAALDGILGRLLRGKP